MIWTSILPFAAFVAPYILVQLAVAWARLGITLVVWVAVVLLFHPLSLLPTPFAEAAVSGLVIAAIATMSGALARNSLRGYGDPNKSYWAVSVLIALPLMFLAFFMGEMATDGLYADHCKVTAPAAGCR